jgi:hypothetical protein
MNQCTTQNPASLIWAIVVGAIVLLIVYAIVSSNWKARRQRLAREKTLPFIEDTIVAGKRYNVCLSDGKQFTDVELVGTADPATGSPVLGGWEGMIIMRLRSGKRVFARQHAIRYLEEFA